jgi:hypothetical protein
MLSGMTAYRIPKSAALKHELEVIAGDELSDVLQAWPMLNSDQADRLARYLRSELDGYGMLSLAKARECGMSLGKERAQARAVLAAL